MIKIITRKKFIIVLILALIPSACSGTKTEEVIKSPNISTDQNVEAIDEDDEEYDSSNVYSQDSDN